MQFFPFSYIVTWCKRIWMLVEFAQSSHKRQDFFFSTLFTWRWSILDAIGVHISDWYLECNNFPHFLHCCMVQEDFNVRRVCSVIRLSHKRQSLFFSHLFTWRWSTLGGTGVHILDWYIECNNFPHFLTLLHGARGFECQKSLLRHHTKGSASFFT